MYNEQQKKRFLDGVTDSSRIKAEAAFKRVESYEKKCEMDCACFTVQEILACFKQINSPSINTLRNMKSALSVYADWCKEQNLLPDGINHYREIDHQDLFSCLSNEKVNRSILTKEEVMDAVRQLENAFEKVAVLLAYEGFLFSNYDAAYMVSTDNIYGDYLKVGEIENEASPELLLYIEEAEEAELYYWRKPDGDIKEIEFLPGGGPVFKRLYNAKRIYDTMDLRRHYFERLFRRIREYTGINFLTVKSLNESGRINSLKSFMETEGATDARAAFMANKKELDLRYGTVSEVGRFLTLHKDTLATD